MRRILIDVHPNSTKVCIANNGLLEEFWVERKNLSRLVGNVYKGKVENVLPGMQAAFVNIGLQRNAFLYAGDVVVDGEQVSADKTLDLREGDTVLCQVEKDEFGNKGARVNAVVAELNGEKVDIIQWSENPLEFIAKALSPAKVISVTQVDEKSAIAVVPDDKLSLAIGRDGQNARLAARLTGWKIDVKSESAAAKLAALQQPSEEDVSGEKEEIAADDAAPAEAEE